MRRVLQQHRSLGSVRNVTVAFGGNTSLQDCGRDGYWRVGVPPSGPLDWVSFRLANRIVGNASNAPALEVTIDGPWLVFHEPAVIAWAGARFPLFFEGRRLEAWRPIHVPAGRLMVGSLPKSEAGCRGYLAVRGGFKAPKFLGSVASFPAGAFGGFTGKGEQLKEGDVLELDIVTQDEPRPLSPELIPSFGRVWHVGVVPGPQEAPDFLTPGDAAAFYNTQWKVTSNASKLGVRLQSSVKFEWARPDGGGGGSHPSNLHDNAYGIGSINFTGDHPVILGVDGPSLGGFVCPATIPSSELSKIGQMRPAVDAVRFSKITLDQAVELRHNLEYFVENLRPPPVSAQRPLRPSSVAAFSPVAATLPARATAPAVVYRVVGDRYVLIEYGDTEFDLHNRVRLHHLDQWLQQQRIPGLIDRIPGVRSLLVQYDSQRLHIDDLLATLRAAERELGDTSSSKLPSRLWKLPLAFRDRWTRDAIDRYMVQARSEASYLPDNVDFVARANGLADTESLRQIIFNASYMCLGLGDVYLGAPCAVPVDPRHRLTVPKYNPARTYTPEGAVGIGGTYMCIYPMDSPGGYQLIGRTLPIWNRQVELPNFKNPWLLEMFDQIRYYQVEEDELEHLRTEFKAGRHVVQMEDTVFDMGEYGQLVEKTRAETREFQERQKLATQEQLALDATLMKRQADAASSSKVGGPSAADEELVLEFADRSNSREVGSPLSGLIIKALVPHGSTVKEGEPIFLLNSMKMTGLHMNDSTLLFPLFVCSPQPPNSDH